jgi:replicative DNA helicase
MARSSRASSSGGRGNGSDPSELHGRVQPHDLEAEKAVLSAILLDDDVVHSVAAELSPDDFYHPAHRTLFQSMVSLKDENQPVDLTTLADYLNVRKLLDQVGGAITLAEIADFEATSVNAGHYARIVADKALKRRLIHVSGEIAALAYEQTEPADQLLDEAESRIFSLGREHARTTMRALGEEMHSAMNHVDFLMERSGELTGLPTGFPDFDEKTGGLQPGDLIIVAARPSMGKTAFALNVGRNAAIDYGKKVAIFSLEMTARALALRLLSAEARVDASAFRKGFISPHDYQKLSRAAASLSLAHLHLDDSTVMSALQMRAKARRLQAEHGLDLVIVDYLQLVQGDRRIDSREQEISEISRGLKALAKELHIPVIALSQLNRGPEQRGAEDKRPILADLRESGAIEQDADVIGFIYRDSFYNPEADEAEAELIIRKQRNGPTGTVHLSFLGRYALFGNRSLREDRFLPPGGDEGGGFASELEAAEGSDVPF